MDRHGSPSPGRARRFSRAAVKLALAIIVILVLARIAAAQVLQWYVNTKLDESPDYAGQVGDIDLALFRGAYRIEDIEIMKITGSVPVPLFAARAVEFSVLWRALLNGAVVGEAVLHAPQINIVDSEDDSRKQTGEGGQWLTIIDDLFPVRIDRVSVNDGQVHFRNFDAEPRIDVYLSRIEGYAQNLANRQAMTESPIARIELKALAMEESDLSLRAALDPRSEKPTFDIDLRLLGLSIMQLDDFIRAYAPFDVEAGTLDIVSELAARDGKLEGYVKPIVYGLDVFKWSEDIEKDEDNPLRALWEGLVGLVAELLQNQPHDQLASNIPITGDIGEPGTNVFVAVAGVLKNAFVEAYQANIENTISLFTDNEEEEIPALPAPLGEESQ